MKGLHVMLEAENLAQAEVVSASRRSVHVELDASARWDAQGLLHLSALLRGLALTLSATE